MKKLIYILLFFCYAWPSYAATYSYYFADDGKNGSVIGDCTSSGDPCKWISTNQTGYSSGVTAQDCIDGNGSGDTVNIYLAKGDTWSFDTSGGPTINYGLYVESTDPTVNIDSFGSGAKPKLDGSLTDFSTADDADETGLVGPLDWSNILQFEKNGCSVSNIHIDHVYGREIKLGDDAGTPADSFTATSCAFTNFGSIAICADIYSGTIGSTVTKCLIHTGQQLMKYGISAYGSWGGALEFSPVPSTTRGGYNNTLTYNVIYDIYGEGVHSFFGTAEYNIIGDTWSVAFYVNPFANDAYDTVVRYNLITQSSSGDYNGGHDGISIVDEGDGSSGCPSTGGGSNASATVEVYGNVLINRNYGIHFNDCENSPSAWQEIRIYNNTVIDSYVMNIAIEEFQNVAANKGFVYNNLSILYDTTGNHHVYEDGTGTFGDYWTVDNNHYWDATEGDEGIVDAEWQTNYVVTDPKLAGEEQGSPINWDGLSSGDPRLVVDAADVTPNPDSGCIGHGGDLAVDHATWDSNLLNSGIFDSLPDTQSFTLKDQDTYGDTTGGILYAPSIDHRIIIIN